MRNVLAFKGVDYDYLAVNLLKSEQQDDEFAKINPMKAIPALVIDGYTLAESVAICEYLEETRPQPPLLPKDAYQRAKVRQIVELIAGDIQPLQNLRVINKVADDPAKRVEWAGHFISQGFDGKNRSDQDHQNQRQK